MNLIQPTLELIRQRLNSYFQAADPIGGEWVTVSNLVDQEGRAFESAKNKVVIFLANIQHDTTISTRRVAAPLNADRFAVVPQPIYINLFLLFYANFSESNYPQGLGMISRTIQFFQANPYFDHQNLPGLPTPIDKLAFEFANLDPMGLNYLMGLAGVKYLPSVYYKVRMLPFQSDTIQAQVSPAHGYRTPEEPTDPSAAQSQSGVGS